MKNKKKLYIVICIVSFAIVLASLSTIGILLLSFKQSRADYSQLTSQAWVGAPSNGGKIFWQKTETQTPENPEEPEIYDPVDIPVDFDFLLEQNQDIIGWIQVEGTTVDYPILYDTTLDLFYLTHNFKGTKTPNGSIAVLGENSGDFTDFITVIYGHNMLDKSMFSTLHRFRNEDFFNNHGQIVIYTPERRLIYQVFAAYRRNDRSILGTYDLSTPELRQGYINAVFAQEDMAFFNMDYPVTESDRIITLSTCVGHPNYRYLVQAVLVSDEPGVYNGPESTDKD